MKKNKNNFKKNYLNQINSGEGAFSKSAIRKLLINRRVSLAKKYHDYHILDNYVKKETSKKTSLKDEDNKIYKMMPKRRNWISLGKRRYTEKKNIKNT